MPRRAVLISVEQRCLPELFLECDRVALAELLESINECLCVTTLCCFGQQSKRAIQIRFTASVRTRYEIQPLERAFRRTGATSNFSDVFVSKLNPTGTALVYSTFIGGSDFDWGRAIAIDAAGNAYVTGETKSSNFPTTGGAFDTTFNVDTCPRCGIDQYDAFVTKLNASGSALVYSTFLGGFDFDDGLGIAVDGAGNAYVTGETGSLNFPTTAGAFDTLPDGSDAFITKLNPAGPRWSIQPFWAGRQATGRMLWAWMRLATCG